MGAQSRLSKSLRVIGQVLQQRGLDFFDLKYADDEFILQCGGAKPPYLDLVEFSCSRGEVERLDEVFRAIGRRIDDRNGQLLRVCNSDLPILPDSITVEYQTRDRQRHIEKFFLASVSEDALHMYKTRAQRFAN